MKTIWIRALFALALSFAANRLSADEVKGLVKSVDLDKHTITLAIADVEKTFDVAPDAKVTGLFGKKAKKAVIQNVKGGLKGVKEKSEVTLTSVTKDGKAMVTQVKLEGLQAKVKKKKKNKNS